MKLDNMKKMLKDNEASIMIWTGAGMMLWGAVDGILSTPEAMHKLDVKKRAKGRELTVLEKVQAVWSCYAYTAVAELGGLVLIGCGDSKHHKRNAALLTTVTMTQQAARDYRNEVKEYLGEKKEREVQSNIVKRQIDQNPPTPENTVPAEAQVGMELCWDPYGRRYFMCSVDKLKRAGREVNRQFVKGKNTRMAFFYDEIDLEPGLMCEDRGWLAEDHRDGANELEVYIVPHLTENNKSCISWYFSEVPEHHFDVDWDM